MSRDTDLHWQSDFSATEFLERRRRLLDRMSGGLGFIAAATESPGFDPFRQCNDFYYLTGVEVPHAYLTMNANSGQCTLYLPPRNERFESTDGPVLSDQDGEFVRHRTGIDQVLTISRLTDDLSNLTGPVWLPLSPAEGARQCQDTLRHYHKQISADPLDGRISREHHQLAKIASFSPKSEFRNISLLIHRQRLIKSEAEASVMRTAGKLTALATLEAMKSTRAGVMEFQLAAVADYFFGIHGTQGSGYRPIIATGANIPMMHYWRNRSACQDGELVLFDYAPDYRYYTSDIGRMWPVNGRYSPAQRELYGYVLRLHDVLLAAIRPGKTKDQVLVEAAETMRPVVESTLWSKPIYKAAALKLLESKRPLSHGVGMPVHEADEWASRPLEPGLVFAVDPELLVPEENLYIRVEDTVLVTQEGIENLTAACPREMDDVERIMKTQGLLQLAPPAVKFAK